MKIVMKDYNLDSFQEKDIYTFDEIIAVIESLEEELHDYRKEKNKENKEPTEDYEEVDEDRLTLAYFTNLSETLGNLTIERND